MTRRNTGTVVVGAGLGGLATAALLAEAGEEVIVLEQHSAVGGCAGYFDRYDRRERSGGAPPARYRFDVGATTLAGYATGRPVRLLCDRLGLELPADPLPIAMAIHPGQGVILRRHADLEEWIGECVRAFGAAGQEGFWREIAAISRRGWDLALRSRGFPPRNVADLLRLPFSVGPGALPLLPTLSRSIADLLRKHRLGDGASFVKLVDELLMITAQNDSDGTPLLMGAMGLDYPSETWSLAGGMSALALLLADALRRRDVPLLTRRRVTALRRVGGMWEVETSRGEGYVASRLVSNLTSFATARLVGSAERRLEEVMQGLKPSDLWGALTIYLAIADDFDDLGVEHHQIHVPDLPQGGGRSLFVSLSKRGDLLRAPQGWRCMTVSTHLAGPARWMEMSRAEYVSAKRELADAMFTAIGRALPGFAGAERRHLLIGGPRAWEHYTGRRFGNVGGIPFDRSRRLLRTPSPRSVLPGLHLVGDTVWPGQGAPGVILGALGLVDELLGVTRAKPALSLCSAP